MAINVKTIDLLPIRRDKQVGSTVSILSSSGSGGGGGTPSSYSAGLAIDITNGVISVKAGTTSTTVALGSHTHTKADIGLGSVDNTADATKSVAYAGTTATANYATTAGYATSAGSVPNAISGGQSGSYNNYLTKYNGNTSITNSRISDDGTTITIPGFSSTATIASTYGTISNLALKAPIASPTFTGNVGVGAAPVLTFDVGSGALTLPATSGNTIAGMARIGYSNHAWGGTELNFGVSPDDTKLYPAWIQAQCPQNYSVSRPLLLNPNGGNVGIGNGKPIVYSGYTSLHIGNSSTTGLLKFSSSYNGGDGLEFYQTTAGTIMFAANGSLLTFSVTAAGSATFVGTVTGTNHLISSDKRLKENIKSIGLQPVAVEYKSFNLISEPTQPRYGVIAQELAETHPELVRTDDKGIMSVAYTDLLCLEVANLKAEVKELKQMICQHLLHS